MATHPFMQVDAFSDTPLGGNPCAIVFDADALDAKTMQAIARENNLSETSFVMQSRTCDVRVRYFTPMDEVPMAGHPTIATAHALVESGRVVLKGSAERIMFEMNVGPIAVDVSRGSGDGPIRAVMTQKRPEFLRTYAPDEILPYFGLTSADLHAHAPIQTVSTGTPQLFIVVKDQESLRRIRQPSESEGAALRSMDFFSVHLVCLGGFSPRGATFARHFALPPGSFEDPFTGSATGGMGAYLWRHGLIEAPRFVAEQGHWMGRPGEAIVEVVGSRREIEAVRVGGIAVTVIRGEMTI